MTRTILLDMDDVVVDLLGGLRKLWPDREIGDDGWSVCQTLGITHAEFWDRIVQTPNFWADLDFTPQGRALISAVNLRPNTEWWFATSPTGCAVAAEGKYRWVEKHLGKDATSKIVLVQDKWLLARQGAVLIDDRDYNVEAFCQKGGIGIHWPRNWNNARFNSHQPLDYVLNRLEYL